MWRNKSVAETLRWWIVVVAIAPLLIMTIQGYHCARQAVLELKYEQLKVAGAAKEQRISDWLMERSNEMKMLARLVDSATSDLSDKSVEHSLINNLLHQTIEKNPAYESVALYSADWDRIADSVFQLHDEDKLLPQAFRDQLEEKQSLVVSKPHVHENGMLGIHIGVPLSTRLQLPASYIVGVLELSSTLCPVLNSEVEQTAKIRSYIASNEGILLTSTTEPIPKDKHIDLPENLLNGDDQPIIYRSFNNQRVIGVATQMRELNWILISESGTKDAFMWLEHLKARAAITGGIAFVLVIIFATAVSKRVSLPLRHMALVAHDVSVGAYDARMKSFQGREHAEVAIAFNQMLDEIAIAQAKLAHAAALSAIGELSASMVHEMRNPLSAIMMNLKVLKTAVKENPLHSELAEIAVEQSRRLETMLGDLLQYGKKVELHKTVVPVQEFITEIEACIRRDQGDEVSFSFENKSSIETIFMDKEQMLRAITNLIDNAIQASPAGEKVVLTLRQVNHALDELIFEVSDNGSGISDRIAEKLFDPFFTTKKEGTGLGLSSVKKIVELHGGRITFRNKIPGTIFTVAWPQKGDF
jgi:signal transduction histidine kinase